MGWHVHVLEEREDRDEVLGVIWSFFWQLAHSQDRRMTQPVTEPSDDPSAPPVLKPAIDSGTGLPMSANDLRPRAYADDGIDFMYTSIIPPEQLARAATYAWTDEGGQEKRVALAYIPRQQWTDEMTAVEKENLRRIKRKIHSFKDRGWFDLRPINPRDREMEDLDWTGKDRMTIGFSITYEGWVECQSWISKHPEWDHRVHILDVCGEEVAKSAPEWLKQERKAPTFSVGGGGFPVL